MILFFRVFKLFFLVYIHLLVIQPQLINLKFSWLIWGVSALICSFSLLILFTVVCNYISWIKFLNLQVFKIALSCNTETREIGQFEIEIGYSNARCMQQRYSQHHLYTSDVLWPCLILRKHLSSYVQTSNMKGSLKCKIRDFFQA